MNGKRNKKKPKKKEWTWIDPVTLRGGFLLPLSWPRYKRKRGFSDCLLPRRPARLIPLANHIGGGLALALAPLPPACFLTPPF